MTYVLVASDKFKGSLTAAAVGEAVSAGIRGVCPNTEVVVAPVADGGDGTLAAAVAAGYRAVPLTASGPTGEPVATCYARRDDRAVVELADVSGLSQLSRGLAPLTASSRGTGEVIAAALDAGCRQIVLGVGGSACKKSTTTRGSAGSAVVSVAPVGEQRPVRGVGPQGPHRQHPGRLVGAGCVCRGGHGGSEAQAGDGIADQGGVFPGHGGRASGEDRAVRPGRVPGLRNPAPRCAGTRTAGASWCAPCSACCVWIAPAGGAVPAHRGRPPARSARWPLSCGSGPPRSCPTCRPVSPGWSPTGCTIINRPKYPSLVTPRSVYRQPMVQGRFAGPF